MTEWRRCRQQFNRLERLGRVRLSQNFFMRDFLHSEIATSFGIPNLPDDQELAIEAGMHLCSELLEPLNATFGRISIRSAFRCSKINAIGHMNKLNCAANSSNAAHHIWDVRDSDGCIGATACVVVPWFVDRFGSGADWRSMAYWIHDHLPYSEAEFYRGGGLCVIGLSWHERPKKNITSWMAPRRLLRNAHVKGCYSDWYSGFPRLKHASDVR